MARPADLDFYLGQTRLANPGVAVEWLPDWTRRNFPSLFDNGGEMKPEAKESIINSLMETLNSEEFRAHQAEQIRAAEQYFGRRI